MATATIQPINRNTRLDARETYRRKDGEGFPGYDPQIETSYSAFRHRSWEPIRRRTTRALKAAWIPKTAMLRFDGCGVGATLHRSIADPNKYQLRSKKCKSRWCMPCARERGRSIAATLADIVGAQVTRFITLTIRTKDEPLKESLEHLTKSFARLRHTALWKQTQTGGAAFLEVKWNPDRERWHPHIHVVAAGKFIPKQALVAAWTRASRGSFIVDVRLVKTRNELCNYITKYVTKGVSSSVYRDDKRFVEAIKAMKGKRTCTTFGTWRGCALVTKPTEDEWVYVCSYEEAIRRATTNPWCDEATALRALTKDRKPGEWTKDDRAPPNENRTEPFYGPPIDTVA